MYMLAQVNVSIKPDRRDMRVLAFEDRHDCAFCVSLLTRWPDFEGTDPQVSTYGRTSTVGTELCTARTARTAVAPPRLPRPCTVPSPEALPSGPPVALPALQTFAAPAQTSSRPGWIRYTAALSYTGLQVHWAASYCCHDTFVLRRSLRRRCPSCPRPRSSRSCGRCTTRWCVRHCTDPWVMSIAIFACAQLGDGRLLSTPASPH